METVRSLVEQHWKAGVVVLALGFVLGVVAYFYAYRLAVEGMEKRKIEAMDSISIPYSNIRGKGMLFLVALWHPNPTIMEVRSMTKKEAMVKLKGAWRTAQSTTKMKAIKDLYMEVKNLDAPDTAQVPANVEQKVSNV